MVVLGVHCGYYTYYLSIYPERYSSNIPVELKKHIKTNENDSFERGVKEVGLT